MKNEPELFHPGAPNLLHKVYLEDREHETICCDLAALNFKHVKCELA